MAAVVSSYPSHLYHQGAYSHPTMPLIYNRSSTSRQHRKGTQTKKPVTQTTVTKKTSSTENVENKAASITRPRREPRIHRQVILLPTPEPIYRQVRHRLPTPERAVIQRTIIQKSNGDVIVQEEQQQRKKLRSQSRPKPSGSTRPQTTSTE